MRLRHLWLTDFRSYEATELAPADGLTVIVGPNGEGKTNLLEAVGWVATLSSFRGAPTDALVRAGAERAVVRAEVTDRERTLLVEAELVPGRRDRIQLNRQPLRRSRDLLGVLHATVFSPDDLQLVKGGPSGRRRFLDDTLVAWSPRHDGLCADVDRILRQRNALLKQAGGRLSAEVAATLDVWDAKLAAAGERLAEARHRLVSRLGLAVAGAYIALGGAGAGGVELAYEAPWRHEGLAAALELARSDDLRRGVTTVGPHRDELGLAIAGLPARTHASQGEQRTLALALRLAAHEVVADAAGTQPVLLLDDVFSELDAARSAALLANLPAAQALLTTAGGLPEGAEPDLVVGVRGGAVVAAA